MSLRFIALFLFVCNSLLDTGHLYILQHVVYATKLPYNIVLAVIVQNLGSIPFYVFIGFLVVWHDFAEVTGCTEQPPTAFLDKSVKDKFPHLPNFAQIPVIAPLAPHERRLRHKLPGTDREPIMPDTRSQNAKRCPLLTSAKETV